MRPIDFRSRFRVPSILRFGTRPLNSYRWPFGLVALVLALLAGAPGASAAVDEQAFINLFRGAWVGSGTVLKFSAPLTVSCRAAGRPTTNRIMIDGSCSVSIISVRIGADISYDPKTDRYSGTYIGAKVGPAHVVGKRNGSTVNLAITWPMPVNGDTNARMTIENAGKGSLHLTIFDNLVPGGPEKKTTDVTLSWALK